jgi:EAL domain-containing protein (putative c-di-GMP-specific phosphodiesterase class I)
VKILLLDDEPFALKLLSHQLQGLGYSALATHEHPRDALAVLEADPAAADLVMLDLQMPEIDGVEFVRHLARLRFAGSVVLVSGEDERILQTAHKLALAHRLDILGVIHKPVTPPQLQALLGHAHAQPARPRSPRKSYGPDRLARAIADGELVNWYQPKVRLADAQVAGVETLVRWQHPEDGLVFPDQFITMAEEHDLIDDLTRAVLDGALAQARQWHDAGLALQVAVNVSMDNLAALDFPDWVARRVVAAGVPLDRIVLEVTESRLMKNALTALEILTRLRLKHIGLSIDDFGTGHSSLAQLRDIPFDELKIDRGFVHGAHANPANHAIIEASLVMAHHLGLRTVGEGVEDLADWNHLRALGCDLAQGYFIAKPMPGPAIVGWLKDWDARRATLA